ncbi:YczE/YyaS/YitT family protein [Anaerorhabdus sp.]|uniref:YczE/YyaS/YitT family protein n=1 Tax=Anaerorhabdus sp. TaxID=1872524 RepID=UPI002B221011|nr:DUF6198 family protein [Anaerorhabdus sp.]MEA4875506.1 DUF6198 family protein [Anaerorhabdus sp.]
MEKISNDRKNISRYILALILIGVGVNLFLIGNFGSDPLTVLQDGMHISFNISVGTASILYNSLIIIIAFFINRKNLRMGTIIYSLIIGFFIDFFAWIIPSSQLLIVRIIYYSFGQIFISLGFAFLIKCGLGMTAIDIVLFEFEKKININYKYLRSFIDVIYVVLGYLLGGILGIGTMISALSTGFLINIFIKKKEKINLQNG